MILIYLPFVVIQEGIMLRKYRFTVLLAVLALVALVSQSTGTHALAQDGGQAGPPPSLKIEGAGPGPAPATAAGEAAVADDSGPGYYSISPFTFTPYISPTYPNQLPNYSAQAIYNPGTGTAWYDAPVVLQNGTTVKKLVLYYYDNDAANGVSAYICQCPVGGQGCSSMASVSSSGAVSGYRSAEDSTVANPVINTALYTYHIEMSLGPGSNILVSGLRIEYSAGSSLLPMVVRSSP
jgi:hypothetical protein